MKLTYKLTNPFFHPVFIINNMLQLQMHKNKGHKRTSPGSNPEPRTVLEEHPCKVCKVVFETNSALVEHTKMHTINCESCDFKTDTNNQLASHMRLNHKPSVPIKCSFCPDTFMEKKNIFSQLSLCECSCPFKLQ